VILLSVLHIFWLERDIYRQPLIYAAIVGVLLMLRLPPVRRASCGRVTAYAGLAPQTLRQATIRRRHEPSITRVTRSLAQREASS
jgi:DMSO/TMAO reductase YedYZ heme-binding membrane subunit